MTNPTPLEACRRIVRNTSKTGSRFGSRFDSGLFIASASRAAEEGLRERLRGVEGPATGDVGGLTVSSGREEEGGRACGRGGGKAVGMRVMVVERSQVARKCGAGRDPDYCATYTYVTRSV